MPSKTTAGKFFEDFTLDQELRHPTPRTVTAGDRALFTALYPHRFALHSSDEFARSCGLPSSPLDDLAVFHIVFGKSVPDISRNAIANLGYADCTFHRPVFCGDTLHATSKVIGRRQNSNGKTGVVYVRTTGRNQRDECVVEFCRWVMVRKRDADNPAGPVLVPELPPHVSPEAIELPAELTFAEYDFAAAGGSHSWQDYAVGERIDHIDGVTVEESEHSLATRLWQNTARVHFDQQLALQTPFKRRIVYGGHVISLARALTFNGFENAQRLVAINGGTHVAPCFAGDTVYAWSEVLEKASTAVSDIGLLRLRTVAIKDRPAGEFSYKSDEGKYAEEVLLDMDWWVCLPA